MTSYLNHDIVLLNRHRYRFSHIRSFDNGLARRDLDGVTAEIDLGRIAKTLAGANVEFPAMPGAANNLAGAGVVVLTRFVRFNQSGHQPLAHRAALVRASVEQPVEVTIKVEHRDLAPAHGDELPLPRWNFRNRGDDMLAHE